MPLMIDAGPKLPWVKRYATEIGVGLSILALIFILIGFFMLTGKSEQRSTTIQPPPLPVQTPAQQTRQQRIKPVRSTPKVEGRIIEQPQVKEIAFTSGGKTNLLANPPQWSTDSQQVPISLSVVKIRTFNGMTAVSIRIDGSANTRSDITVNCPLANSEAGQNINIIDNLGRRYRFLGVTREFPERLNCVGDLYTLAPHEVAYQTFLFDELADGINSLDVNFHPWNSSSYAIHVAF